METQHEARIAQLEAEVHGLRLLLAERDARLEEKNLLTAELLTSVHHERQKSKGIKPLIAVVCLNILSSEIQSIISAVYQYEKAQSPYLLELIGVYSVISAVTFCLLFIPARGIVLDWLESKETSPLISYLHQSYLSIAALLFSAIFVHTPLIALPFLFVGVLGFVYNVVHANKEVKARVGKRASFSQLVELLKSDYRELDIRLATMSKPHAV